MGKLNPSQSYGASPATRDHTRFRVPATRHRWTLSALTPAKQAGTRFTYREKWKGELNFVINPDSVGYLSAESHTSK